MIQQRKVGAVSVGQFVRQDRFGDLRGEPRRRGQHPHESFEQRCGVQRRLRVVSDADEVRDCAQIDARDEPTARRNDGHTAQAVAAQFLDARRNLGEVD